MITKVARGSDEDDGVGGISHIPRMLIAMNTHIMPWLNCLYLYGSNIDRICKHMRLAGKFHDIKDLTDTMEHEYKLLAIRHLKAVCSTRRKLSEIKAVARGLELLQASTVLWPKCMYKYMLAHNIHDSLMGVSDQMLEIWAKASKAVQDPEYPEALRTVGMRLIVDPVPQLEALIANIEDASPEQARLIRKMSDRWAYMVKEGISEEDADTLVRECSVEGTMGKIEPQDTEAAITALIGIIPADMPMDGIPPKKGSK